MKLMLTGAGGMLGSTVEAVFSAAGWTVDRFSRADVDFSRPQCLRPRLAGYALLIHAAANTNVEACETDLLACYRDNTLLTEMLASAARANAVPMVYVSSTGVYGRHAEHPYHEFDTVQPTTHHHRAKYLGEAAALSVPDALVVRTGWLFGGPTSNRKNFVARRLEEAARNESGIQSNSVQRGCPSFAKDVASRMLDLIERGCQGVFNCVNDGNASRYEYVAEIVKAYGLATPVAPASAQIFARKAMVSDNEMAINLRQDMLGLSPMRPWQEALAEYIEREIRPGFDPYASGNR